MMRSNCDDELIHSLNGVGGGGCTRSNGDDSVRSFSKGDRSRGDSSLGDSSNIGSSSSVVTR